MSIRSFGLNSSDHVYTPHRERPRCCQDVQRYGWSIDIIGEGLALVAFPHMDAIIVLHSELVIPYPQNLLGHGMPVGMCSKGSLMHFYQHFLSLPGIHTPKQHDIMVPLVQDIPT